MAETRGSRLSAAIVTIGALVIVLLSPVLAKAASKANPNSQYTVYVRYPGPDSPAKPVARRVVAKLKALGFDVREQVGDPGILWDEVRVDHAVGHRPMAEKIRDIVQQTLNDSDYQTKETLVRQDDDRKSRIIWVLF